MLRLLREGEARRQTVSPSPAERRARRRSAVDASSSTRLGFPRWSSVAVLMLVAAALAAACVALVVAQEPARATFPGANGDIAFVGLDAESTYQIFTVSPSGENLRQLTFDNISKESLAWSPDGRKIAFVGGASQPGHLHDERGRFGQGRHH